MQSYRTLAHLGLGFLSFGQLYGCSDGTEPGAEDSSGGVVATSAGGSTTVMPTGGMTGTPPGTGGSATDAIETGGSSAGGSDALGTGGTDDECTDDCGCTADEERICLIGGLSGSCGEGSQTCASDGTWSECMADCDAPSDCIGYVGITYDDGPANTDAFVNALSEAGLVPVTFFVNGSNIRGNTAAIEKMMTVGEVQSHGFTHTDLGNASVDGVKSELEQNNDAIVAAGAPKPTIFRPPYGSTSGNMSSAAAELDMIVITWDIDSSDWNGASPDAIVSANERMSDGQVILMHENQNNSLSAIPQIAAALEAKGMCPGKLDPQTGRAVAP